MSASWRSDPARRRLILASGMGVAALPLRARASGLQSSGVAGPDAPAVVVVMLRGAVDGLSVVVPHADPEYRRVRAEIAIPAPGSAESASLPLDSGFGLHPSLARLMPWWQAGQLAFVHASGSPDPTRSHFDAQDFMETATPGRRSTPSGWLNRLLALSEGEQIRGMNLGTGMPRILSGKAPVGSIAPSPTAIAAGSRQNVRPGETATVLQGQALEQLHATDPASASAWRALQQSRAAMQHSEQQMKHLREMAQTGQGAPASRMPGRAGAEGAMEGMDPGIAAGALPLTGLSRDAQRLGQLLRTEPGLQAGFLSLGGWDTHVNQGGVRGALANRLRLLGDGLDTLAHSLGPRLQNTVIVVMSEFGRTVSQNGTQGTDHGHGNVMWLLGGPVKGGRVHGEWPGLERSALHEGRDLAITTDFRAVLQQVLERHMQLDDRGLQAVLPQGAGRTADLDLLRA
ncbi:MAG: DUF1501 domain-containing protein [Burkholderiaceae bacterium]